VYNFADLARVHSIETADNPSGLCALSASPLHNVLACPSMQRGKVRVELYDSRQTVFVNAHESDIACLQLNHTGSRLATASVKGTLVRIFDTAKGTLLQELRRGSDHTTIWSIAFNPGATMLALTSEKGTCHVFKLAPQVHDGRHDAVLSGAGDEEPPTGAAGAEDDGDGSAESAVGDGASAAPDSEAPPAGAVGTDAGAAAASAGGAAAGGGAAADAGADAGSLGGMFAGVLPRFMMDDRSYAQFRTGARKSICAFGAERNTVIVVTDNAQYLKASFDGGGKAERIAYAPFGKATRA